MTVRYMPLLMLFSLAACDTGLRPLKPTHTMASLEWDYMDYEDGHSATRVSCPHGTGQPNC